MTYEEFEADFQRVHEAAGDGLSTPALQAEILRLRQLAETIEDPRQRENAGYDIAMLDDLVAHDDDPAPSALMVEASGVYRRATAMDGTPAERIARAEAGIEEIERIADRAVGNEQASIAGLNETLSMLIMSFEPIESR
jgi:HEAT repeat protein